MNREILFRGFHPDEKVKEIIYIDGDNKNGESKKAGKSLFMICEEPREVER